MVSIYYVQIIADEYMKYLIAEIYGEYKMCKYVMMNYKKYLIAEICGEYKCANI